MAKVARILRRFHNLETMAVEIYRVQLSSLPEHAEHEMMVKAMENEMLHRETFQGLLDKHGASPSPMRLAWWVVGRVLGRSVALLGHSMLFRGDVAFEEKAVREYTETAGRGELDPEEREFFTRFLEDEKRHVANWKLVLSRRKP